jgi:Bacterial mobilisation protein (MobC)
MLFMAAEAFIQCRVPQATKAALRAAAERQQLTESALLKRMLELVLHTAGAVDAGGVTTADRPARQARLYVRLTAGDRQLLQERSAARCLAPATYASILLRAHLRALTPLPEAELRALRQSTRELAAIGRNLNQIARATHQGGAGAGVGREDLWGLLKACEALRDHVRAYISTNLYTWGFGDATSQS